MPEDRAPTRESAAGHYEPQKIEPKSLDDYLEVMTKSVFQSGMSWQVVKAKWDGFRRAFHEFDVEWVASLTPPEVDAICANPGVIRNRPKIEATVANAAKLIELDRANGGIRAYFRSFPDYWALEKALKKEFKFLGSMGVYLTMFVVGEDVPEYHEWREARPMQTRRR